MGFMAHIYPLHILIAWVSGLVKQQPAELFDCLIAENRVQEQLKGPAFELGGLDADRRSKMSAAYDKRSQFHQPPSC
jgi:hypothetical protein